MARFEIQMNGRNFEIEAPDFDAATKALQGFGAKPAEAPIEQGDWAGLQNRLNAAEQRVKDSGPYRPQDIDATLKGEARRQGLSYGQAQGEKESSGGIFGTSAINVLGLGLPRYLEAVTNPTVKTAYAHEFLKAADEGRHKAAPIATGAGTVAGYVAQAAMLPASGAATVGGRALAAAGQSGTLSALEAGIDSRGDLGKMVGSGVAGGIAGGVASAGMEKAIQLGRMAIDPMRGLAKSGPADQQAVARILLAAKNAGIDDAVAQRKFAELGPEGFLADVLGTKGQALARTSANLSPNAREVLETASRSRIGDQQARLIEALQGGKTLPGASIKEAQAAVYEAAKPGVKAAYAKAGNEGFANPINWPDWMKNSPAVQDAIRAAQADTKNRIAAFGAQEGSQFAVLDAARQNLANRGFAENNSTLKELARKINGFIDDNVSSAATARKLSQAYKQEQAALEIGGKLAGANPLADALAAAARTANPAQIEQGYLINKIDAINRRNPGKLTVDFIDSSPAKRRALVAALGNRAAEVTRQTGAERKFLEFDNALRGNSTTARQLAEMGLAGLGTGGASYAVGFDPQSALTIGGAAALAKRGGSKLVEALAKKNEAAVAPEVARRLIERSLPSLVDARGKPLTETARRHLVEALMKVGGRGGALAYGQN